MGAQHGRSTEKKIAAQYPDIDPRFLFLTTGFNLRPTEINAAIGLVQDSTGFPVSTQVRRRIGRGRKLDCELAPLEQAGHLSLIRHDPRVTPAPFGYTVLCRSREVRNAMVKHLEQAGIETRPVICGNLVRQPALSQFEYRVSGTLAGSDRVMDCGLSWGSHPDMTEEDVDYVIATVREYFQMTRGTASTGPSGGGKQAIMPPTRATYPANQAPPPADRHKHHSLQTNQLGGTMRAPHHTDTRSAVFDRHVLDLDVAGFMQASANATKNFAHAACDSHCEIRSPAGCCACVGIGHAADAPSTSGMNSRRFNRSKCIRSPPVITRL